MLVKIHRFIKEALSSFHVHFITLCHFPFQAMFFADQLLSRMPAQTNAHIVHGLHASDKGALPNLSPAKKVSGKVF